MNGIEWEKKSDWNRLWVICDWGVNESSPISRECRWISLGKRNQQQQRREKISLLCHIITTNKIYICRIVSPHSLLLHALATLTKRWCCCWNVRSAFFFLVYPHLYSSSRVAIVVEGKARNRTQWEWPIWSKRTQANICLVKMEIIEICAVVVAFLALSAHSMSVMIVSILLNLDSFSLSLFFFCERIAIDFHHYSWNKKNQFDWHVNWEWNLRTKYVCSYTEFNFEVGNPFSLRAESIFFQNFDFFFVHSQICEIINWKCYTNANLSSSSMFRFY